MFKEQTVLWELISKQDDKAVMNQVNGKEIKPEHAKMAVNNSKKQFKMQS